MPPIVPSLPIGERGTVRSACAAPRISRPRHLGHLPPQVDADAVRMSSSKQPPYDCARTGEINDSAVVFAQRSHHLSKILYGCCPSLVDRGSCRRFDLTLVE